MISLFSFFFPPCSYEEFGVLPTSSLKELQDAGTAKLKAATEDGNEIQMNRIGKVYTHLKDPKNRDQYNGMNYFPKGGGLSAKCLDPTSKLNYVEFYPMYDYNGAFDLDLKRCYRHMETLKDYNVYVCSTLTQLNSL